MEEKKKRFARPHDLYSVHTEKRRDVDFLSALPGCEITPRTSIRGLRTDRNRFSFGGASVRKYPTTILTGRYTFLFLRRTVCNLCGKQSYRWPRLPPPARTSVGHFPGSRSCRRSRPRRRLRVFRSCSWPTVSGPPLR